MIHGKNADGDNFLALLRKRDERGLDYVIDTYGGMIRAIVRRQLSSLPDLCGECENDILLAVWNEAEHFDAERCSFAGWLAAVCRYKAIDCLRRSARRMGDLPLPEDGEETGQQTAEPAPRLELREEVEALLQDLPEEDRSLFWDCYVRDEPPEQLARERNIKTSAVYNRLSRGRKKLRQCREVKQ